MGLQVAALEALCYATYNALLRHEPFPQNWKKKHRKKSKATKFPRSSIWERKRKRDKDKALIDRV
jgi:hypothetical protein